MQHKFSHQAPYVPRWKEKYDFNGKLTIPDRTELLERLTEEKVKAQSQKKKDRLDKEIKAALKRVTESQNGKKGQSEAKQRLFVRKRRH